MKKPRKKNWTLFIILCVLPISCAIKPPDVVVCKSLQKHLLYDADDNRLIQKPSPTCHKQIKEPECGACTYIVSGRKKYIGNKKENHFNGKSWKQIKEQSILVPAEESYAPLATYIINSCKKANCDKDVNRFKIKVESLEKMQQLDEQRKTQDAITY